MLIQLNQFTMAINGEIEMVLSAEALGITDISLYPAFCVKCSNRIGWTRQEHGEEDAQIYCEECAKQEPTEEAD